MKDQTVTISVNSRDSSRGRFLAAMGGESQGHFINFEKASDLARILTDNRLAIIEAMTGKSTMSIRKVAQLVRRDIKSVYTDIRALIDVGIVQQDEFGVIFPYTAVHVDFTIKPASSSSKRTAA